MKVVERESHMPCNGSHLQCLHVWSRYFNTSSGESLRHLFAQVVPKMTVVVRSIEVESLLVSPQHVLEVDLRPNGVLSPGNALLFVVWLQSWAALCLHVSDVSAASQNAVHGRFRNAVASCAQRACYSTNTAVWIAQRFLDSFSP